MAENNSADAGKLGRPYQVDLVNFALSENTIVNLGTGAGKTFVAVMLIRELSHQTRGLFNEKEGQRTIFLAHTVPLVKQQAEYIREHTSLTVSDFCGDMKNIDNWPKEMWYGYFNANNVLVFSRAIFLDLLLKGFIKPHHINLIIFDECHHATKNDPFVQIMKVITDAPSEERPRVLGLSASLLGKKVKPGKLGEGVHGLETILMSRARTAPDLSEVIKYATNPEEKVTHFSLNTDAVGKELLSIISPTLEFLQAQISNRKQSKNQKFPIEECCKSVIEDLTGVLKDLGPASAAEFVGECMTELRKTLGTNEPWDEWEKMVGYMTLGRLTIFNLKCEELKAQGAKFEHSNKVNALLLELADDAITKGVVDAGSSDEDGVKRKTQSLRGIIFTERRHTASCLTKLIKKKSETEIDLKHISCEYVVGHNAGQNVTSIRREARMKSKDQNKILSLFRKGRINLLVATSVIEEGVDVPRCNLVVRFDMPQNFRSFLQSKGRARDKPSTFLLLVGDHEMNKMDEIKNYHVLEKELIELCQSERSLPTEEEIQMKMADKIPPYMPNGREGARATVGNSLSLLHRYCEKLPHDEYTVLAPTFKVMKIPKFGGKSLQCLEEEDEDPNNDYICYLKLPNNCPINDVIESPPMNSKRQSERAAARFAIERLHQARELNDIFKPTPSRDSDDEDVLIEKGNSLAGTDKMHRVYETEIATVLKGCQPIPGDGNYLYVFVIKNSETGKLHNSREGIGILMNKQLSHWKIPSYQLYLKSGITLTVSVELFPLADQLTLEDLEVYKDSHHNIFSKVICIQPQELVPDFNDAPRDYLIVPVTINSNNRVTIDQVSLDFPTACKIVNNIDDKIHPSPPFDSAKFRNKLVFPAHRDATTLSGLELFTVEVDDSITPQSPFIDTDRFATFADFFKNKYQFELTDNTQPSLISTRVSMGHLKFFTSRYTQDVVPSTNKKTTITLFPQLVYLYPLSASFWLILRLLPAILWRFESLLIANQLSSKLTEDTGIGKLSYDTLITTDTSVLGYRDAGHGQLPSKIFKFSQDTIPQVKCTTEAKGLENRSPDNNLIIQALTPRAANDSIDLERLELLGDSFLKLVISVHLYNSRHRDHEGRLSEARSRRVSNINLFCKGRKNSISKKILGNDFNMGADGTGGHSRVRWIPPGFALVDEQLKQRYLSHKVNDKCVADCIEALIGAYTVASGIGGGLLFMKWLGIKMILPVDEDDGHGSPPLNGEDDLLFANSGAIFLKYFGPPAMPSLNPCHIEERNNLLSQVANVQQILKYKFTNTLLLIEAMTHPSYSLNPITDCYQRLEFLGDAILDYIVTCQIYRLDATFKPGNMTELRSAIVCNAKFAELVVSLDLHKCLLHQSPSLFKALVKYAFASKETHGTPDCTSEVLSMENNESLIDCSSDTCSSDTEYDDEDDDDDNDNDLFNFPKCLSDCFESLAGAVFIDSGMNLLTVWNTFKPILMPLLDKYSKDLPSHPVKELYDKMMGKVQVKKKIITKGSYSCIITIDGTNIQESAVANTYRIAKTSAAAKVLQKLADREATS